MRTYRELQADIGGAIRFLRANRRWPEKGITQRELAERCFVSLSTVQRWERGTADPTAADLWRIAAALGTDIYHLVETIEDCGRASA